LPAGVSGVIGVGVVGVLVQSELALQGGQLFLRGIDLRLDFRVLRRGASYAHGSLQRSNLLLEIDFGQSRRARRFCFQERRSAMFGPAEPGLKFLKSILLLEMTSGWEESWLRSDPARPGRTAVPL